MSYPGNGGICILYEIAPVDVRLDGRNRSYCKPCKAELHVWRTYGLTREEVEELLIDQDHRCKVCHEPRKLFIDHDHVTKKIRGLLCQRCNSLVGFIDKHGHLVDKAREYVTESGGE